MISGLLVAGFLGGVVSTLLAIKILPVKISFDWQATPVVSKTKKLFVRFRPDYCKRCGTAPCQSDTRHAFED